MRLYHNKKTINMSCMQDIFNFDTLRHYHIRIRDYTIQTSEKIDECYLIVYNITNRSTTNDINLINKGDIISYVFSCRDADEKRVNKNQNKNTLS